MFVLFLADGFEEVEALTPLDMLRRAGVEVTTVGVGGKQITGAHGIPITADMQEGDVDVSCMDGVILPGGMPGTKNLEACQAVQKALDTCADKHLLIAAICAAPSILGHKGLLQNKKATCFPGFEADCAGAQLLPVGVVRDGNIITAKGAGCALYFGAEIVAYVKNRAAAEQLVQDMQWNDERYSGI